MATYLGGYYLNPHDTQFDGSKLEDENCTPAAGDNGANASTGGKVNLTAGGVRALIPRSQETNPATPGWSLEDLDHAMAKVGVPFVVRSGDGWTAVTNALHAGLYVAVQGDSDQFSNATCSGAFNGDHCIGIHPATRVVGVLRQHWIDDGICKTGRWEYDYILHRYAAKLDVRIRFGVFSRPVPKAVPAPVPVVTLRYGGIKLSPVRAKSIAVAANTKANVRNRPTKTAVMAPSRSGSPLNGGSNQLPNHTVCTLYQYTKTGQLLAGSRIWYGDRTGTRWLHISAF